MSDVYKLSTGCDIVGNVLKNWKYIAVIVMMAYSGFSAPQKDEKAGFFLAGVVDTKSIAGSQEREKQLISMLDALSSASSELAVESSELAAEVNRLIAESGISPARAASLRLKAQSVIRLAGKVASVSDSSRESSRKVLSKCRIVAVNPKLGIVAIEAGARHGVFKGMVFHTLPGNPQASLRITMTHPDISAAEVISGSINQLGAGMSVSAVENRKR